jgi:hypothetical protein
MCDRWIKATLKTAGQISEKMERILKCVALWLKFLDLGPRVSSPGNTAEAFREET